jgi:tetratricopeptide (TPR) repeat protein
MTSQSLKEEARRHELREEWSRALEAYLRAIDAQEDDEDPDIALHNRVGDLRIRLGDVEGAVESYEKAIDLYVAADLPNNAIAVCRKVIRHAPKRPEGFLRLGRLRAEQGFLVDARQHVVTYVEMMRARGELDPALQALEEFTATAPEDVETRVFLAELLASRDRVTEACDQLAGLHRVLVAAGRESEAERILARVLELDPDRDVSSPPPAGEAGAPPIEPDGEPEFGALLGFETTSLGTEEDPPDEPEFVEFQDLDGDEVPSADPEGGEDTGTEAADPFALEFEIEGEPEAPVPSVDVDEEPDEEPFPLPILGDLPPLEVSEEADPPPPGDVAPLAGLEAPEQPPPEDVAPLEGLEAPYEPPAEDGEAEDPIPRLPGFESIRIEEEEPVPQEEEEAPASRGKEAPAPRVEEDPVPGEEEDPASPGEEEAPGGWVDFGALVREEPSQETTRWVVPDERSSGDEDEDFARMLGRFKEKVSRHLAADDARVHYDLGTAYKEMGLLDEAIAEFQQALRADPTHLATFEVLGQSFLERGEPNVAVRILERALSLPARVEEDRMGIYYHLAHGYEIVGNTDSAREFYEKVFSLDINFKDVTARLRRLRARSSPTSSGDPVDP